MLPSRDQARALIGRTLALSRADEARVRVSARREGNVRFALSGITSCGEVEDLTIEITSGLGKRKATVSTNVADDAGILSAVRASEDFARLAPEDPEYVQEAGARDVPELNAWFEETASVGAPERASAAGRVAAVATPGHTAASGYFATGEYLTAVGTSRGFVGIHRDTRASFRTRFRTSDGTGSGWAGREEPRISSFNTESLAKEAAETARRAARPSALEPGSYAVVLTSDAVADLLPFLLLSLDARLADEGRSAFSRPGGGNRLGERIFGENITLSSDPRDPMLLSAPFSAEGVPLGKRTWIQAGVLADLSFSRWWATRQGGVPDGGIGCALLHGGASSFEDLVRSTDRGVLVNRFHSVEMIDSAPLALTGVTRDGAFLIEKGRVAGPVKDLRFNHSLLDLLSSVDALGVPRRTTGTPIIAAPPLKARAFAFTSIASGI